jgi:hypothetical protein
MTKRFARAVGAFEFESDMSLKQWVRHFDNYSC